MSTWPRVWSAVVVLGMLTGCNSLGGVLENRGEAPKDTPAADPITGSNGLTNGQLNQREAEAIAWQSLQPLSHSGDQANWHILRSEQVLGGEVEDEFMDVSDFGCPQGEEPNEPIHGGRTYWYVMLQPLSATPRALGRTPSATEPPAIPEPYIIEAHFLIDPTNGEVIARAIQCVLY